MAMMQAPVVFTNAALEHIQRLDLPDNAAARIKALLTVEPLGGNRCYPAWSIAALYPEAGLYELDGLFHTKRAGWPRLVRARYFFAATRLTLLVLSVELLGPPSSLSPLTFETLELVESIAARYAVLGKS